MLQAKTVTNVYGKNLGAKSLELPKLKLLGRLFVSESISHGNELPAYKYRQLKCQEDFIYSTMF